MKMEKYQIVNAEKGDLDFIIHGLKEIDKIEGGEINNLKSLRKKIVKSINKKQIICMKYQDNTIGFLEFLFSKKQPFGINYEDEKTKFCWANNMFIDEKFRRNGIGSKLFKRMEEICKEKQVKKILFDVFEINRDSKAFCEKEGFRTKINIMEKKLK